MAVNATYLLLKPLGAERPTLYAYISIVMHPVQIEFSYPAPSGSSHATMPSASPH